MTDTVFTNNVTLTDSDWFNDLNRLHYTILGDPADVAAIKALLHPAPGAIGGTTPAQGTFTTLSITGDATFGGGTVLQNSKSAAYEIILSDANKHILHPSTDNNPRTITIPSNASIAFAVGVCVSFINEVNTMTIAITSDTLTLAGAGTTGSRTLAANGIATAIKTASTKWLISGTGLS